MEGDRAEITAIDKYMSRVLLSFSAFSWIPRNRERNKLSQINLGSSMNAKMKDHIEGIK